MVIGTPAFLNGQSTVTGTALDAQGYVYVTGSYYGTVQFGSFTLTSATTQPSWTAPAVFSGSGR